MTAVRLVTTVALVTLLTSRAAAQAEPAPADSARTPSNDELARRIDLLARELDDKTLGGVAGPPTSHHGLGPAASKIYDVDQGVSLGGYGEMLYSGFGDRREDGVPSGVSDQIDLLRQIVYVGYKYDAHFLFNSEIEFEHASTEGSGSVSVEFAYIDALLHARLNARGGLMLVPMGITNELHEPPVYLGARRPETEVRIIPSTWSANGIGLFGDIRPGLSYRAYLIESLDCAGFEASGLREGRQGGGEALFETAAGVARLEWAGRGMRFGASIFHGGTAQGRSLPSGPNFQAPTTIADLHCRAQLHGVHIQALVAMAHVGDAAQVNALRGLTGDGAGESVGEDQLGWYAQAGYDLLSRLRPGTRLELVPYFRYEEVDTQRHVPQGFTKSGAYDDQIATAGMAFYPHPQVVVKADYQWLRDAARTGTDQWNTALGFLF